MNRFTKLFAKLEKNKQGAFMPFVTIGDPDLAKSFEIICTLVDAGADALELGLPFSDPLLDGAVIQAANNRALESGSSTQKCFELLAKVRNKYPNTPISLLLCANLIYAQGLEKFYQNCADAGIDAVLIADLPVNFAKEYIEIAKKFNIAPVFICPPNADENTIKQIAQNSQGYTYLVSRSGVTSAENQNYAENLKDLIEDLKKYNAPPIVQGFGITTPLQVKNALQIGANGAIAGSAIVKIIAENLNNHQKCLQDLQIFIKAMKDATKNIKI